MRVRVIPWVFSVDSEFTVVEFEKDIEDIKDKASQDAEREKD